jgi:hypothetical protein
MFRGSAAMSAMAAARMAAVAGATAVNLPIG